MLTSSISGFRQDTVVVNLYTTVKERLLRMTIPKGNVGYDQLILISQINK